MRRYINPFKPQYQNSNSSFLSPYFLWEKVVKVSREFIFGDYALTSHDLSD